ncbi:MAG: restriction endonuclease subunit S domain-containing protein, partial [Armatimonadota bacterium]
SRHQSHGGGGVVTYEPYSCPTGESPAEEEKLFPVRSIIGRGLSAIRDQAGHQQFLYWQLRSMFKEEDSIGGGTIFKAVTKEDMHRIPVIIPQSKITDLYEAFATPVITALLNLSQQNDNLRQTRNLLLPKLISGEVDVSELDITAPSEPNC